MRESVKRTAAESAGMIVDDRNYDGGLGLSEPANNHRVLSQSEAIRLLGSVDYGRVVFTLNALPAIRPVNHLVDEGRIIIRTRVTKTLSQVAASTGSGVVVAYEADEFDSQTQSGWSVVAIGRAHHVIDPGEISRYEQLLHPWVNHADTVLAIELHMITGLRITSPAT